MSTPLTDRAKQVLKTLVELYIREGQPVGSKVIVQQSGVALSSASIRHIMADLEDAGFLCSPHTSAGRIPTAKGYRLFVDSLLTVQSLDAVMVQQLKQQLHTETDTAGLLGSASDLLSSITQLAGVVTVPKREQAHLRHVEFLPLGKQRVLVVLVLNQREVQNRVIHTTRRYSASELQQVGNYLTRHYAGKPLAEIHQHLVAALHDDRKDMERLMQMAVDMADQAFAETSQPQDYLIAGETNLLPLGKTKGVECLQSLFTAFNQKRDILHLLDQCLQAEGVQIFIGEESSHPALDDCSLVMKPYVVDGAKVGVLGVIGPVRMAYERVIPTVDITAQLLGAAFSEE